MKILQVNCVYAKGSTGKIVYDIHNELIKNKYESIVCFGRGDNLKEKKIYKVSDELYSKVNKLISFFTGLMYSGCFFSTNKLINIIKKEKPDIVHLQCINGNFVNIYRLIEYLKKNKTNTILTLHAEFMYTANCGYALDCEKWKIGCGNCPRFKNETKSLVFDKTNNSWKKMYNSFENFNNLIVISVSPWLMERAMKSPILRDKKHVMILNGLDTNIFKYCYNTKELKKKLGLENKKIIFHVTAGFSDDINHIKGGYYILKLAQMIKNENIQILVAGSYDKNIVVPDNIILLGKIENQELLAKYYSMADVTVLTSKKETFSIVTAESLCRGSPVVGFKAGAPEQIAIKEYSEFVNYGDIDELYDRILNVLRKDKDLNLQFIAKEVYSKEKMVKKYIEVYQKLIGEKNG